MRFFAHLLLRHLRQYPGRALAAVVVLGVAAALMLLLAGMAAMLNFRVGGYLAELFPEERMRLEALRRSIGPVAFESNPITQSTLDMVRARPDVAHVWPIESVRFPIRVEANILGNMISTDAIIQGAPRVLVEDAISTRTLWHSPTEPGRPYPVVLSRYLLDMYNMGYARSTGLPMLEPAAIVGKGVDIFLNESTIGLQFPGQSSRSIRAVLVGFSSNPALMGIVLPDDAVAAFNREFLPGSQTQYVQLLVDLKREADRPAILAELEKHSLTQAGGDVFADKLKRGVRTAAGVLTLLAAAVILLGMLTFYTLFSMIFHARRLDLMRLRALGMSARAGVALAMAEVLILAGLAVAGAAALIAFLERGLIARLTDLVQQFASLPPGLLQPAGAMLWVAAAAILFCALLPALPMLAWVVRTEPANVIRDL